MYINQINRDYSSGTSLFFQRNPSFNGRIETEFFKSLKAGNQSNALKSLNNIKFDITVQDTETGNNALHYVLQSGSAELWKNLQNLIDKIILKINPSAIQTALNTQNKRNRLPLDLITDNSFKNIVSKYFVALIPGMTLVETNSQTQVENNKPSQVQNEEIQATDKVPQADKVGNEVESIDLYGINFDFDSIDSVIPVQNIQDSISDKNTSEYSFNDVIGAKNAVNSLTEYIVKPIKNNKPILVNGILLYGQGDNGKTFLINELAKTLNKEVVPVKKVLSMLDSKQENSDFEEIKKILDSHIISLTLDDAKSLDSVLSYITENYQRTGNQTLVFIDEIAKFFSKGTFNNRGYANDFIPDFMQRFDNFSQRGGILLGTTNDINYIQSDLLRANRFQKRVELSFPSKEERAEIFEKYCKDKLNIKKSDYEKILKKTAGFSYGDLTAITRLLNAEHDQIDYKILNNTVEKYAEEHEFGELSDEGTTSNYDTKFLKRTAVNTNFADVAGLESIKDKFRKTIINRLNPEVRQRFKDNNRPLISTNFLLYGPPGTGKTFIVKALSGETKIPLYIVDASSFADKYVGESEKNLRRIFSQLENKFKKTGEYSILFFDEANKILGKRDGTGYGKDSEYVEQLLQYIDNSYERGIITITATNYKEKMDDAVLSRLGEQMKLDYPDIETIQSLISIILKRVKIAENITESDIKDIASKVRGFGSREITQMITKIIDEHLQKGTAQLTAEDLKYGISLYAQEHELPAINERNRTSAYDKFIKRLEISPNDPQSLNDVGGMKEVKEKLLSAVMATSSDSAKNERYKKNGVKPENGILLYGAPGCGKTYIMKALAAELNIPIYEFKLSQIGSKYQHETTNNIGKIFGQLKSKYKATGEKSILMLDEFEDIAGDRSSQYNSNSIEETNAILKEISEAAKNGIIVVAATNYYNNIDSAMKRPGRFLSIEVTPPDYESRRDIISKSLIGREIAESVCKDEKNFETLAQCTNGLTVAEITETINQLVRSSIDLDIEQLSLEQLMDAFKNKLNEKTAEKAILTVVEN